MATEEVALLIDLENITTSLWRNYQQNPDPFTWMEKARKYGPVAFARAYGDFTQAPIARLTNDLRAAGIEKFDCPTKQRDQGTQSTVDSNIIIDLFEVAVDRPNIKTFVLMAGDSDYIRVVTRLRNRLEKRTVICGVPGSTSRELVRAAGDEDPIEPVVQGSPVNDAELVRLIYRFENTRNPGVYPVFNHLERYVADPRNLAIIRPELAQQKLSEFVREGILIQEIVDLRDGQSLKTTRLNPHHPAVAGVIF